MNHNEEPMHCASCGICIGPDYDQRIPEEYLGDKPICSFCNGIIEQDGFLQVDVYHRLMPDGERILRREDIRWKP